MCVVNRGHFRLVAFLFCMVLVPVSARLMLPARARAAYPGANGKVAFFTTRDGNQEIYSNTPGVGPQPGGTRLTNDPNTDSDPTYSSDGTQIAFVSDRTGNFDVYKMNAADGSGVTDITNNPAFDADPTWSPDGTKIAFVSDRDGNLDLFIMNSDGTGTPTRLTTNSGANNDGFPAWSPDGATIAYERRFSDHTEICSLFWQFPSTANCFSGVSAPLGSHDEHPTWSPDNKQIAFDSDRAQNGSRDIYRFNADGSSPVGVRVEPTSDDQFPAWSPDGTRIAFAVGTTGGSTHDIYTMLASDGSISQSVSTDAAEDDTPDWQPLIPGYPRPQGATPERFALVPTMKQCTSSTANTKHDSPLFQDSCVPATLNSQWLTVGTLDANNQPAKFVGSVRMDALAGPPADIRIVTSTKDIRKQSDLNDYTGQLQVNMTLRVTDKRNAPGTNYVRSGTVTDQNFAFTVPCTATVDTTVGSNCNLTTTANSVTSGYVSTGKRAIFDVRDLRIDDGGSDGVASTQPNTVFLDHGIFVP
jgi:Tol biopolymer transport system component